MPDKKELEELPSSTINSWINGINEFRKVYSSNPIIYMGRRCFTRFIKTIDGLDVVCILDGADLDWQGTKVRYSIRMPSNCVRILGKDDIQDPFAYGFTYRIDKLGMLT